MPTVAVQRTVMKARRSLTLTLTASIDTAPARGRLIGKETHRQLDWYCHWQTDGDYASAGIALLTKLRASTEADRQLSDDLSVCYELEVGDGDEVVLEQWASLVPNTMHTQPHRQAGGPPHDRWLSS